MQNLTLPGKHPAKAVIDDRKAAATEVSPYLSRDFAPVSLEADAPDQAIRGDMPKNLTVTLCRNGPNPQFAQRDTHFRWFLGAGMMHAFRIEDGRRFADSCLGDVTLNSTHSSDFSRAFTVFRMRTLRSETNIYAVPYGPRDCPRQACAR